MGVWKPAFKLANSLIGGQINWNELPNKVNGNIEILSNGKWWLKDFVDFQYGELKELTKSKALLSYIKLLKKHNLWKRYLTERGIDKIEIKKVEKKNTDDYNKCVKYFFKLHLEKRDLKASWSAKEGELLYRDLKRLEGHEQTNVELLCLAMEAFFNDEVYSVKKFAVDAGYSYGVFHSQIDKLLNAMRKK